MTTDEPPVAARDSASRHRAAINAQRARARGQWAGWLSVVGVVVLALGVVVAVVYQHGEYRHVRYRTAAPPAAGVVSGAVASDLHVSWRSGDRTAAGDPVHGGTVVTFSAHSVNGRSARTGQVLWFYARTDRDVCGVVVRQNQAVALFGRAGKCDEMNALDAGTGRRVWQRTLDDNGRPIDARPALYSTDDTVFVVTGPVVYAIAVTADPCVSQTGQGCGLARWSYQPSAGCDVTSLAAGEAGALIAEHCRGSDRLVLRDGYTNSDDKNSRVLWTKQGPPAIAVEADSFVGAYEPASRRLGVYDPKTGARRRTVRLPGAPSGANRADVGFTHTPDATLLLRVGSVGYAVGPDGTAVRWSTRAGTLPRPLAGTNSPLFTASDGRVSELDGRTGRTLRTYRLGDVDGSVLGVERLGRGFLAFGDFTAVYQ